jgi:glycosyltransferase involved in cell wall biosynthesis
MMPFAINDATRFISPTKTLEYMAGQKPIVSTPIPDIVGLYGAVVRIAADAPSFVEQVEAALAESPTERADRNARERQLLRHYEWSRIAGDMGRLVDDRLARRLASSEGRSGT